MEILHERVAGLDVHKEMVVACVRLTAAGRVSCDCRTHNATTAGFEALLAWLLSCGCTRVAMEATGVYWKPFWNVLSDGDFDLVLANATHIENVPGCKTDPMCPSQSESAGKRKSSPSAQKRTPV